MKQRRSEGVKERRKELFLHPLSPEKIYLVQTDTTVGFLSQNAKKLAYIKKRDPNKPFLISVDSFRLLKDFARVPNRYKNLVRRAKKTTFIYPNKKAIRVVKDEKHLKFLKRFGWMYSTSANESGKRFEKEFAYKMADVIVEDERGFFEGDPSRLIKIGKRAKKLLR